MSILQKADSCLDEAVALFGENKLFLAEKKAQDSPRGSIIMKLLLK